MLDFVKPYYRYRNKWPHNAAADAAAAIAAAAAAAAASICNVFGTVRRATRQQGLSPRWTQYFAFRDRVECSSHIRTDETTGVANAAC